MTDKTFITHAELDGLLSDLAREPEDYPAKMEELGRQFDRAGTLLELSDPMSWREAPTRKTSFANQFEADIDSIRTLDREDESALARRIEFSRLLVNLVREREGLPSVAERTGNESTAKLPGEVARRENELQTLRKEMVERNLYLVMLNVSRYAKTSSNRWDLIQEGCASLFRAVDGFDWTRGLLFRTYAVHWLNQAFRNHLYNFGRTVRVPVYLQKALKHINAARLKLGDSRASALDIAQEADLSESVVVSALAAANRSVSIDAGRGDDGDTNRLADLLEDDNHDPYSPQLEDVPLGAGLARELQKLNDRERKVIEMRFGLGLDREYTLSEVAGDLGVSVERIRQIQVRAVSKMNSPALRRDLEPYLN